MQKLTVARALRERGSRVGGVRRRRWDRLDPPPYRSGGEFEAGLDETMSVAAIDDRTSAAQLGRR